MYIAGAAEDTDECIGPFGWAQGRFFGPQSARALG